jgi:hypothetical protein
MPISADIEFHPENDNYRLILPAPVTEVLSPTNADGKILPITHENKMQLEWLAQKIVSRFNKLNEDLIANRVILKRKKNIAVGIIILAAVAALFKYNLARVTNINILYINVAAFAVGIIACLQLLKYFALSYTDSGRDIASDLQIIELKELIQKDYSL